MNGTSTKSISLFLFFIAALVLIMASVGAATRLTESGLSIVEWKPVTGALPPMTTSDWQHEFQAYQASPQFQKVNAGMTVEEYKKIFWWEWAHRLLGRVIGLVYVLGLGWFWLCKEIPEKFKWPMIGILALGGGQGVMGWLMVASGLVNNPAVSHYRLAAHLLLAVALYIASINTGLAMANPETATPGKLKFNPVYRHSIAALALLVITLTWGSLTAGLRAGLMYNTWPLMNGHWTPDNFWFLHPWWKNFFENDGVVQYVHRCLGYITSVMCISIGLVTYVRRVPQPARNWGYAVAVMGLLQPALGIITILMQVQIHTAAAHQAGAFVLMALLMIWIDRLRRA